MGVNMKRGYDHAPRDLILEAQIVQHRLDFELDFTMSDDELRHVIYTKYHRDNIIYTNSLNLKEVLTQCKTKNITPIIALNFFWALRKSSKKAQWVNKITPADFARCSRLVA